MTADWLTTGEAADRLVDDRLKDGGGKILAGSSLVDERLDIGLCKYTTARCDRIDCLVILGVLVQTGRIRLDERCHLIDKGTGTAGTDSVHTLFYIAALEVDDLGILTAKLDGYIGLWGIKRKRSRYRDNLLHKRNAKMLCERKSAGAGDHRGDGAVTYDVMRLLKKRGQGLLNVYDPP